MRIKMKVLGSGPDGMLLEGHEYDLDDKMGQELVDGGYADLIPEPAAAEEEKADEPAAEEESEEPAPAEKPKPKRARRSRKAATKESEE